MKRTLVLTSVLLAAMLAGCGEAFPTETEAEATAETTADSSAVTTDTETAAETEVETVNAESDTAEDPSPELEPTTFSVEYAGKTYTFTTALENGEPIYQLVGVNRSARDSVKGSTIEQFGNYFLTDCAIFTPDFYDVLDFTKFAEDFEITSKEISEDGNYFHIEITDVNGKTLIFDYGMNEYESPISQFTPVYVDGEYSMIYESWFDPNHITVEHPYYVYVEGPVPSFWIGKWGEYTVFNTGMYDNSDKFIMKEGEKINSFYDPDYRFDGYKIVGDYLYSMNRDGMYITWGTPYNTDLEPVFDEIVNFTQLSDGRYIGEHYDYDAQRYVVSVFDKEMNIASTFDTELVVIDFGNDFVLIKDKDGVIRLYSPDMELLCEFGNWKDEYEFADTYVDTYEEFGAEAYVFKTYDYDDKGGEENRYSRCYEFYYIPETGISGVYDAGHTYYADGAAEKPVLYLYPEAETDITVTFDHPELLTTVYPAYNDGWSVTAEPDGTLTDENGRTYYCLYWEERYDLNSFEFTDGFCVKGTDSAAFLEDALSKLGFTEREANEFIIYWLPKLEQSEYNLINFELTEEREASNALHISPAPDSLLRVAMHMKAVDAPIDIPEQELPAFERSGFVAVEWGGCVH